MTDASPSGSGFLAADQEIADVYSHNEDVIEEAVLRNEIRDDQLEDIIARAQGVTAKIAEREANAGKLEEKPSSSLVKQVHVPSVPKKKKGMMMARLPPVEKTSGPVAIPANAVPDKNVLGEERTQEHVSPTRLDDNLAVSNSSDATIPDKNVLGEKRDEERASLTQETFVDAPTQKFGSPVGSERWEEDSAIQDALMDYPADDDTGGMYGTHDPVLSTTSVHLSDFRSEVDDKISEMAKAIKSLQQDINKSQTQVLDRLRALERKLSHDPPLSVAASKMSIASTSPASSDVPDSSKPRLSLAERVRQRKQGN